MAGMLTMKELAGGGRRRARSTRSSSAFPTCRAAWSASACRREYFLDSAHEETHGCDYLLANDIDMEPVPGYAAANWEKGYGDFVMKPDMATLRRMPWLPGTALVLADILDHHHHEDVPHSPRGDPEEAGRAARGEEDVAPSSPRSWNSISSTRPTRAPPTSATHDLKTAGRYIEDYHILQTTKEEGVMRAIRIGLEGAGIPVENSKGEWGPGQEEINVRYADALTMADRHVIMKNACKEIALLQGKAVTFMAKWRYDLAGSSSHIHSSLWDAAGKKPLFVDAEGRARHVGADAPLRRRPARPRARDHLVPGALRQFLQALPGRHLRADQGDLVDRQPHRRLPPLRRAPKAIRIECRIGGADLNPYLAFAALIAAGLAGIEEKMELEAPFAGDAYLGKRLREMPKTLREATALMDKSKMLRAAFGDDVIDHYVHTAEWEQFEYDRRITDWELKRGFERY